MRKLENTRAFPISHYAAERLETGYAVHPDYVGMSLRDYFAAKAMAAMIMDLSVPKPHPEKGDLTSQYVKFALYAYDFAEGMMIARDIKDNE